MRRLAVALLSLMVASTAFAMQENSGMKTSRKTRTEKAPPTDCSTVTDSAITANVRASLAKAPSLKDSTIDVTTSAGVVTLKGMVKKAGLKGVATRMTRRVDCVKKVDNQLTAERTSSGGAKGKNN
jgi:osmotically-inducible protein OsmY